MPSLFLYFFHCRGYSWRFILFLFVCCVSIPALALPLCAQTTATDADILAMLQEKIASIDTIESDFTQKTIIPMFSVPMLSQGRFLFKRPHNLLWEYTAPLTEGFALQGGTGTRWEGNRENKQSFSTQSDPITALIAQQLLSWITLDLDWIQKEYDLAIISKAPIQLLLTPQSAEMKSIIRSLSISFTKSGVAEAVVLQEEKGGSTTITFSGTIINGSLNDALFQ